MLLHGIRTKGYRPAEGGLRLPVLMNCVRNTLSLYQKKLTLETRVKVNESNTIVLKDDHKLIELAMEEVDCLGCKDNVGCVRILTEKHPSHITSQK
jgi:hypothetical protein